MGGMGAMQRDFWLTENAIVMAGRTGRQRPAWPAT